MTTPAPNASAWDKMYHLFALQRDTLLVRYHLRSNVESTFSMIKGRFGEALKSKRQVNEVLCKVIAHHICCLISAMHGLGLEQPSFTSAVSATCDSRRLTYPAAGLVELAAYRQAERLSRDAGSLEGAWQRRARRLCDLAWR